MVCEIEPHIRLCADSSAPTWESLFLPLCPSLIPTPPLSLKINKLKKRRDPVSHQYPSNDKLKPQ